MDTTLQAIIYTRKSSEKNDANTSLSTQAKYCLNLADQIGATVDDDMLFQENYTGMKLSRPELNKVMRLLREGKANALIVYSPDRLTRVPFDGATLRNEFKQLGIRLFIYTRGEVEYSGIYEAFNYMQDSASESWRNSLVEATTRGKNAKLAAGIPLGAGNLKFGFAMIGNRLDARVIHVDSEKAIIDRIVNMFLHKRIPPTEIADIFNAESIPTRSELRKGYNHTMGKWRPENIYQILKDPAYIGVMYANRWNEDGSKKPRNEWIELHVPPIIDRVTFDRIQELLADGRSRNAKRGDHNYLIGRLVTCGHCGYKMQGKPNSTTSNGGNGKVTYRYYNYRCPANVSRFNGKVCDNTQYKADVIDCIVWKWVVDLINNPGAILAAYNLAQEEIDADLQDTIDMINAYDSAIQKYHSDLADMADLYTERLITKDIFREKKLLLDKQIVEAENRKREAQDRLDQRRITDADIQRIEDFSTRIREKIHTGADICFEDKRQLIEDLQLTFKLVKEDHKKMLYIYWAIYETPVDVGSFRSSCDLSIPSNKLPRTTCKSVLTFSIPL